MGRSCSQNAAKGKGTITVSLVYAERPTQGIDRFLSLVAQLAQAADHDPSACKSPPVRQAGARP